MAKDPKSYLVDGEVLAMVWSALYEGANDELASVIRDTMIAQGCQELHGITDASLILMFWKQHLEDNDLVKFTDPDEPIH
jgi:hypothetical protein|tara:strand:- start:104 stop:343 length:240 start_codon:yes stop_codon:yes gene_type:complete